MDSNEDIPSDLSEYKRRLSPFGGKIFDFLIMKWNTERSRRASSNRCLPAPVRQRPIPAFPETSTLETYLHHKNLTVNQHSVNDERQFNCELEPINSPNVSTATQLLQSKQQNTDQNERNKIQNMSRFDLLHPVASSHDNDHDNTCSTNSVKNIIVDSKDIQASANFLLNFDDNNTINVPWDDMFDTEVLPKTAEAENKTYSALVQSTDKNDNNFQIDFLFDKNTEINYKTDTDNTKESLPYLRKCKKQANRIDNVPKKIKKISDDKINDFRKQKYTKTVKKWLDNVDLNNPVLTGSDLLKDYRGLKVDNTIVRKDKPSKRVVQMQLANKQGKMKFDRPQNNSNKSGKNIGFPNEVSAEIDNEVTKNDNLKKDKYKFVPVKSQIPVKDIKYKICVIDSNNIDHQICKLRGGTWEIYAVLLYSNDFCQLNDQYTEDDCIADGIMLYVNDSFYYFKKAETNFSSMITEFLEHNTVFCYDGKSLLIFLKSQLEFKINFNINDIQIGGSLLDPDNPPESFADLQKLLAITPQHTVATECVLQKTAWYLTVLRDCAEKLKATLVEENLWNVFINIEMKLLPIIADMEIRGILVDVEKLNAMETTLLSRMRSVERECHQAAGRVFQINSTVQVRAILYDELQLDTKCNIKIRETLSKGAKSTSETMLRELVTEHPLPKLILEYRRLHKAHATFLMGVAQHVREGMIKPTWVQAAAATGRVACHSPNVQAAPKAPFDLRPEQGDHSAGQMLNLRAVYVARARHVLLAADFKHVECRVFAHAAADASLLHALHAGGDLFRTLAAKENKPAGCVSEADRERTKRVVYASLYGAGARTLMDILRVSYERARDICTSFHRTFPSLKSFGRTVVARCADNGGRITTASGRARRLQHVASHQPAVRAQAERQAVNFIVQGSAADLCKMAMVRTAGRLRRAGVSAWLLLQIHDELVWEVAEEQLLRAAAVIKDAMEKCGEDYGMEIPLPVALSSGRSWGELTALPLPAVALTDN